MSDSTIIDSLKRTFVTTATLSGYELVALQTDGTVAVATASSSQVEVGFVDGERSINAGDVAPIRLLNGGGSAYGECAATVTAGDALYGQSGGEVGSAVVTDASVVGYALEAGVDGDVIEILLA